ncbi:hypothetical protein [Cystobacter fuscus]|nr:hypothetical protein [Cystobacter fuscus]
MSSISGTRSPQSSYPVAGNNSASSAPKEEKSGFLDKNQPKNQVGKQWGDDVFDPKKDPRQVSQSNTSTGQVDGNHGGNYVEWQRDVAEFKTGTGFSAEGTGAGFEASALEVQGDANYVLMPTKIGASAGAEANLASVRGDAGFGKDLDALGLGKVDGKVYGGVHGEALVGANADAKASIGKDGVEVGAGALAGAEASGTAKGEFGPVGGSVTGSAIAGVGGAINGKARFEDGKLTIGASAKGALGVGFGVGTSFTIDFNKVKNTADNITGGKASEAVHTVTDGAKGVTDKVAEGAKDLGKDIKKGFSSIFGI